MEHWSSLLIVPNTVLEGQIRGESAGGSLRGGHAKRWPIAETIPTAGRSISTPSLSPAITRWFHVCVAIGDCASMMMHMCYCHSHHCHINTHCQSRRLNVTCASAAVDPRNIRRWARRQICPELLPQGTFILLIMHLFVQSGILSFSPLIHSCANEWMEPRWFTWGVLSNLSESINANLLSYALRWKSRVYIIGCL